MGYIQCNVNPLHHRVGDCAIRAISKALNQDWDTTFIGVSAIGFERKDMPSGNVIWGEYLKNKGFTRHIIPMEYGHDYTVKDFADDHPKGTYILALDGHVVCVKCGNYIDSWDSGHCIPLYYWAK